MLYVLVIFFLLNPFINKVIVVTGGASGIGEAICRKFGSTGSRVAVLDIDFKNAQRLSKELMDSGIEAIAQKCDVSIEKDCNRAIKAVIKKFGGIDILVNNAGITQRSAFEDTGMQVYRKVMDINFFGTVLCTKAAINSLIKRKGMIILTSSIAGVAPILGRSGYCASKHALHGFYGVLRSELKGKGVHVMFLSPGFTRTNLQTRALAGDGTITKHPQSYVGKQTTPEKVAELTYRGAVKKKRIVVITAVGIISYYLARFSPVIFERLQENRLKNELKRETG